ncbi:CerR family C-terminal domain-containing protein [Neorhizobium sp. NCHU2750]|uniref:CerR family C-terminal domain-containing protein n=1 Tax=Neorhizobium sp. NCHU2750 TaxID=1825976 RepID=UPI000E74B5AB|nr:hypothetical protein NCHU2750_57920 [Neorhizobium sp. NCHU2750]
MMSLRRRNAESGYPRGEETRAKIIDTAIVLFGEKGFAGVSTREIASAAGVPPPSLQYYFENKEGLYEACIDDIHAVAWQAIGPAVCRAEDMLSNEVDPGQLIDAYCTILGAFADFLFSTPDGSRRALFIAQHRSPGSSVAKPPKSKSEHGQRVRKCCAAIVARVCENSLSEDEVNIVATTINGQLLIVHLAREHIEDMVGWKEMTLDRVKVLKSVVTRQTTAILEAYRAK